MPGPSPDDQSVLTGRRGVGHTQIVPPKDGSRVWNVASTSQGMLAQLELRRGKEGSSPGAFKAQPGGYPDLGVLAQSFKAIGSCCFNLTRFAVICCSIPGKTSTEGSGLPFLSVSWNAAEGSRMLCSFSCRAE